MFKYILRLLAGKFKIFCTAFPLATIAQKNFRRVSLENFPSQKITSSRKDDKRWLKVKWQAIKTTDFLLEIKPKQFLIFRLCHDKFQILSNLLQHLEISTFFIACRKLHGKQSLF